MTKSLKDMPDVIVVLSYPEAYAVRAAVDNARYDRGMYTKQERDALHDAYRHMIDPIDATVAEMSYAAREAVAAAYSVLLAISEGEPNSEGLQKAADDARADLERAFGELVLGDKNADI